jgi:predicted component of type VI protein secretion system
MRAITNEVQMRLDFTEQKVQEFIEKKLEHMLNSTQIKHLIGDKTSNEEFNRLNLKVRELKSTIDQALENALNAARTELRMSLIERATVADVEKLDEKKADKTDFQELQMKINRVEALVHNLELDNVFAIAY